MKEQSVKGTNVSVKSTIIEEDQTFSEENAASDIKDISVKEVTYKDHFCIQKKFKQTHR